LTKVTIEGLKFSYGKNSILDGLDISVADREVLSLVGPNGCGKTTLIKCISGILRPQGRVLLGGREVGSMTRRDVARFIGYVPSVDYERPHDDGLRYSPDGEEAQDGMAGRR